ncbi:MAG: hypothetical protein K0Q57_108 [Gammaproteobacteria bacterium]|jgi:hypothetical protein|nr:hypothetical protein [Gammaproteobacteria bacterium]
MMGPMRAASLAVKRGLQNSPVDYARHLHLFDKPRPEIGIFNNSGLFFSAQSILEHRRHCRKLGLPDPHPDVTIIIPPLWIDNIHRDYSSLHWGQRPRSLPWYVRNQLRFLPEPYKGSYSEHEPITWGTYIALRERFIRLLEMQGVKIKYGIPKVIRTQDRYEFILPEGSFAISLDKQPHVYNSFRVPSTSHGLGIYVPEVSHTSLYHKPKSAAPKRAFLIGGGRSAIWAAQHFEKTLFACIKYLGEPYPLLSDEEMPANLLTVDKLLIDNNKLKLRSKSSFDNYMELLDLVTGDVIDGPLYCSMGLRHRPDITAEVIQSEKYLTLFPRNIDYGQLVAPEEVLVGSLIEATIRWAVVTGNMLWSYEPHVYYNKYVEGFSKIIEEKYGIELHHSFFDSLRSIILGKDYNITKTPAIPYISTLGELIDIYKKAYVNSCRAQKKEAKPSDIEMIGKLLNQIETERLENAPKAIDLNNNISLGR